MRLIDARQSAGLHPTPGQAHDLMALTLLLDTAAEVPQDKAFDADERVIAPLLARGKSIVIPPKSSRKVQRDFDKDAYKATALSPPRYDKIARKVSRRNPPRGCHHLAQLRTGSSSDYDGRNTLCKYHFLKSEFGRVSAPAGLRCRRAGDRAVTCTGKVDRDPAQEQPQGSTRFRQRRLQGSRAIATRYDKTARKIFSPQSTSRLPSSGSIEDRL